MGVYIGYVEKKGYSPSVYFNFTPIAELLTNQMIPLSSKDQEKLLPDSDMRNINFWFSFNNSDEYNLMNSMFDERSLVIFEFETVDLQPNVKLSGERNPTGYKVNAIDLIHSKKIRRIHEDGIYYMIHVDKLKSPLTATPLIEVDVPRIYSGNKVFIELCKESDAFWVGPYEVRYRSADDAYYIKPELPETKYTVSGYNQNNCSTSWFETLTIPSSYGTSSENSWHVLFPKGNPLPAPEQIDVITPEILLESFWNEQPDSAENESDDISAQLDRYEKSLFAGAQLSESIRNNRVELLLNIFSSEADIENTLKAVTDSICELLVKHQDNPSVEKWVQTLIEKRPDLIENLKDTQFIKERMEQDYSQKEQDYSQLNEKFNSLQKKYNALESDFAKKQAENASTEKEMIKAKLQLDTEYQDLLKNLQLPKEIAQQTSYLNNLKQEKATLSDDVDYLNKHKSRLDSSAEESEKKFKQIIKDGHKEMVDITFDGFIASSMLQAAARWEAKTSTEEHEKLVYAINCIPSATKDPSELIEYLCKTIQIARPTYTENTILNIMICMTQGFLTVFSGMPGCGKTSICNILGKALGLDKITDHIPDTRNTNRYVAVSVEKGWTSKRDFVGYYNPLSKTFDKSNSKVYDALHQLHTEKANDLCKLPYIVLLDEANLSPMEYYWSDFMNICDDLGNHSEVNLGENYIFGIPETLHFLATINTDHTVETLSPRLIDRAWIISLPQQYSSMLATDDIPADKTEIISWDSLHKAFIPEDKDCILPPSIQKIYDLITNKLKEKRFLVSPRVNWAIKRYWATAAKYMKEDEMNTDPEIVALDYAITQRLLPKISGSGEFFEKWLEELRDLCSKHSLNMSATILKDMLEYGNQPDQMKYYRFFC